MSPGTGIDRGRFFGRGRVSRPGPGTRSAMSIRQPRPRLLAGAGGVIGDVHTTTPAPVTYRGRGHSFSGIGGRYRYPNQTFQWDTNIYNRFAAPVWSISTMRTHRTIRTHRLPRVGWGQLKLRAVPVDGGYHSPVIFVAAFMLVNLAAARAPISVFSPFFGRGNLGFPPG